MRHLLALRPAEPLNAADYASLRKLAPLSPLGFSLEAYARMHNMSQTLRTRTQNRKKLLTTVQRSECVYKRAAERSDIFCGEEEQRNGRLIFCEAK